MIALALAAVLAVPASGAYGEMLKLAFDGGRVTGAFSDARQGNGTQAAPQFSCAFMLTSAWAGDHADVLTWWPGETDPDTRIPGRLVVRDGAATLKLKDEPGGCGMTGDDLNQVGYAGRLRSARPWLQLREVRAGRAWFFPRLGAPRGRSYVVQHDVVGVLARAGGWVQAEYAGGARGVRGWLAEGDLYPTGP